MLFQRQQFRSIFPITLPLLCLIYWNVSNVVRNGANSSWPVKIYAYKFKRLYTPVEAKKISLSDEVNSILSIPIPGQIYQFQFQVYRFQFRFLQTLFCLLFFTTSRYSEYLLRVPVWDTYSEEFIFQVGLSWKKYLWIKKWNGKLICGFNLFVGNFNPNSKFINSNSYFF